jgi:hypothetical protein
LLRLPGLRRLLAARWTSQTADGIFQSGLAWLVLFSPDRQQSPAQIAGAAAIILLPFSLVGPFVGVFLDRWSRRSILVLGQFVRVVVLLVLATVGDRFGLAVVYALAITALGVNRLLLAAFSACLPSVVPRGMLLPANALAPTAGTGWVVVGFGLGGSLLAVTRAAGASESSGSGLVLLAAASIMAVAGLLAMRFGRNELGPEQVRSGSVVGDLGGVVGGLVAVLRHLGKRRQARSALLVLGVHRFFFGLWSVQTTVYVLGSEGAGGLSAAVVVAGFGSVGYVSAAVVTPLARRRLSDATWVCTALLVSSAAALAVAPVRGTVTLAAAAAVLGLSAQSVKICVDTAVQRGVDDSFLGRAFVLYDVDFNVAFVLAAVAAIASAQDDSGVVGSVLVAIGMSVAGLAYARNARWASGAS